MYWIPGNSRNILEFLRGLKLQGITATATTSSIATTAATVLQLLQVLLRLLGHSHYSTNSGGRWSGTFWAVLHQVLPGENDAKTLRVDASVFENEKKNCVFKRIRIRVDRAWIKPTPAEIHGRARREELLEPFQIETSVPNWFRRRTFHVLMHCIRSGSWKVGRLNRALSFYAQCLLAFLSF